VAFVTKMTPAFILREQVKRARQMIVTRGLTIRQSTGQR